MVLVDPLSIIRATRMRYTSKRCYSKTKIKWGIATIRDRCKMTWAQWKMLGIHNRYQRWCSPLCLWDRCKMVLINHLRCQQTWINLWYCLNQTVRTKSRTQKIDIKRLVEFITLIINNNQILLHICSRSNFRPFKITITLLIQTFKFSSQILAISILLDTRVTKTTTQHQIVKAKIKDWIAMLL